jgi:hypothetical protein
MAAFESIASGPAGARGRRTVAIAVVLAAAVMPGCGGGSDRDDVPASPIGGEGGKSGLPSDEKLERRAEQARRKAKELKAQLERTSRAAKRASK